MDVTRKSISEESFYKYIRLQLIGTEAHLQGQDRGQLQKTN